MCLSFALLCAAPAAAQDGIRIVRVPDELQLPGKAGQNLLLEVEVPGKPTQVYVAAEPARTRLPMTATGNNRYQANLTDPRVARLVLQSLNDTLHVYAEGDGARRESAAIRFVRAPVRRADLKCEAVVDGKATTVGLSGWQTPWLEPAKVARFELRGDIDDANWLAMFGDVEVPMQRGKDGGSCTLELNDGLRKAWHEAGRIEIVARRDDLLEPFAAALAVPARLELPIDGLELTIAQRSQAPLPGSREFLQVSIDDITGGQVLLKLNNRFGTPIVPQRSVEAREVIEFTFGEVRYVLHLRRLINHLVGKDFAVLSVQTAERHRQGRIDQLLAAVAASGLTFVREGTDYTGQDAARFLRGKVALQAAEPTLDEFVDKIGSRSSTSGNEYLVKRADGSTVTMREWLREQLKSLPDGAK